MFLFEWCVINEVYSVSDHVTSHALKRHQCVSSEVPLQIPFDQEEDLNLYEFPRRFSLKLHFLSCQIQIRPLSLVELHIVRLLVKL